MIGTTEIPTNVTEMEMVIAMEIITKIMTTIDSKQDNPTMGMETIN